MSSKFDFGVSLGFILLFTILTMIVLTNKGCDFPAWTRMASVFFLVAGIGWSLLGLVDLYAENALSREALILIGHYQGMLGGFCVGVVFCILIGSSRKAGLKPT